MWAGGGGGGVAILTPGLYFEQSWKKSTRQSCVPNITELGLLVSDKKILKGFSL